MNDILVASVALAALAILALIAHDLYSRLRRRHRRRRARQARKSRRHYSQWQSVAPPRHGPLPSHAPPTRPKPAADLRDPAQQLHAIARVDFECIPLLTPPDARLLPLLEAAAHDLRAGHRVLAQTSLGDLIRPQANSASADDRSAALASITAKRIDFAIIDRAGRLAVAVDYQDADHHQDHALGRDAIKREALRRAGIPLIELGPDFDAAHLRQRIAGLLAPPKAASVTPLDSRRG